jgi:RNA polymerase sigma-70 factor, ECF subfamily
MDATIDRALVVGPQPRPAGRTEPPCELQGLFREHSRRILGFFRNRGFSREDSFDLTQETFLRAHRGLTLVRRRTSLRSWLFQIAANVWRNELRRRGAGKRDGREVPLDPFPADGADDPRPGGVPDPGAGLLAAERLYLVRRAVQELPARMRHCFLLRVDQELTYREIALILHTSLEGVKSQIYEARRRLRERLQGHFGGPALLPPSIGGRARADDH